MNIVNKYDQFIENGNLNLIQSFNFQNGGQSGKKIQINSQKVTLPTSHKFSTNFHITHQSSNLNL